MEKFAVIIIILCFVFSSAEASFDSDDGNTSQANETLDKPNHALVFSNDEILSFHITVGRDEWLQMWNRPFKYVKCVIRFGDEIYKDVGLRFKGNSSFGTRGLKKSYKFKFDEYKTQNLHGFKKLNFVNAFKDASLLRETLAYELFREAEVPASRTAFAKLYLTIPGEYDEEYIGLYTVVEQVDKRFLEDRFGNSDGYLFKGEGMADILRYRGDNQREYTRGYEFKLGKNESDYSELIRFIKIVNETPEEKFPEVMKRVFNVENFLSYLAVNTLLANLDSYAGTGHNFYLYLNTDTSKFEFIPWDVNEAFGNFKMGSAEDMVNLDIYEPYAKPKIFLERILAVPEFKESYIEEIKTLINGTFSEGEMCSKIDALYHRIEKDVREDMWKEYSTEDFERSIEFDLQARRFDPRGGDVVNGLKPFVKERIESVKAQLAGERRGFIPRSRRPRGRRGFPSPELSRRLSKAGELLTKDVKESALVLEKTMMVFKDLGMRLGGEKGKKMEKAFQELRRIHEEIRRSIQTGRPLQTQRVDEIRKFLTETSKAVENTIPQPPPKDAVDELSRKIDELHRLMKKRSVEGIDVSKAKRLDEKSKEYFDRGDIKGAIECIKKAIDSLKR